MKSLFFIPIFNQARELPRVLGELAAAGPPCDVLLVNNGSSDGSAELVHASGYPWIDVEVNRGIGYSYMLALEWALARGTTGSATMAGNGKMLAGEMQSCSPLASGEADYFTGTASFRRQLAAPAAFRRWAIPWSTLRARLTGAKVTDAPAATAPSSVDIVRRARLTARARLENLRARLTFTARCCSTARCAGASGR